MDPNQTYLDMFEAMKSGDFATARERALALRDWIARGGFCPQSHSPESINATIADLLRRTAGSVADAVPFSLTCTYCDAGMDIDNQAEAIALGWREIEEAFDLPNANYLGVCPDCQAAGH